ncbi:isochorismate synthase [Ferrimonas sediminicola]|uniref:Isochorismate synthase MenF n=1 Tax=Ferrimonas sediminicola TaxID=2569538 RepID=A0A4U1BBG8_9GAMM|nr:isochorismate synthase [Ferrimonas sediminicola]TKB47931.1 isochorismate synthase [Ferrimonas sediminicola]
MDKPSISIAISRMQTRLAQLANRQPEGDKVQLSESIQPTLLLPWLAAQEMWPQIYWRESNQGEQVAALGACGQHRIDAHAPQKLSEFYERCCRNNHSGLRWYGGVAFDTRQPAWDIFGQAQFILPRLEIRQGEREAQLLLNLNGDPERWLQELTRAAAFLEQVRAIKPLPPLAPGHILSRQDTPSESHWHQLVTQVTEPEFNRDTPKVVLARQSQLQLSHQPHPWTVLHAWQLLNPNSYQYGFQLTPKDSFISCSPERLFQRSQQELTTEALAGTTVRGFTPEEDDALAQALLDDDKNQHENQLVRLQIEKQLQPLCDYVGTEESPSILKLNHIQHLHRTIKAEVKYGVNDLQLLQALHPTPAVGGYPRESAMTFIRQREGFSRGWYAGACGYFNCLGSEFSVALRSARFSGDTITLFAGAGIVAGSDPDAEWQELENKLATIMGILNGL